MLLPRMKQSKRLKWYWHLLGMAMMPKFIHLFLDISAMGPPVSVSPLKTATSWPILWESELRVPAADKDLDIGGPHGCGWARVPHRPLASSECFLRYRCNGTSGLEASCPLTHCGLRGCPRAPPPAGPYKDLSPSVHTVSDPVEAPEVGILVDFWVSAPFFSTVHVCWLNKIIWRFATPL